MIGERVLHARLYHGWSQTQLAQMVGVSQPAISQIEKTGQVSDETLDAIARVTQFAPWWFRLGPLPDLPEGSLRYRKLVSSAKRDDARVRAYARQAVEIIERLSGDVNLPPVRLHAAVKHDELTGELVDMWAEEARHWLGVGAHDPIPNLVRAVERAGVFVIGFADTFEKHDAASYWRDYPEGRPLICFSRGYPGDRQRFSIAHELGHFALHQLRKVTDREAESEANRFAGALLLPRAAAKAEIEPPVTLRSLAYVKARWGLSVRALIARAFDLRIINETRRISLEKQMSSRGWRQEEPVRVEEEQPSLMRKLVHAALGPRVAPGLGLPPMAARELVA